MGSGIQRFILIVVGTSVLALSGCSDEPEKPAPDFLAKPATSKPATTTPAGEPKPDAIAQPAPAPQEVTQSPASPTEATPSRDRRPSYDVDNPPPSSVILDEFADSEDQDEDWLLDEDEPYDYAEEDEYDSIFEHDDYADEKLKDDEEEEAENDNFVFYGSRRPHIPAPLDVAAAPKPGSQPVAAPAPSDVVRATVPWTPKPPSEIDALLAEDRAAYPTQTEIHRLKDYTRIPAPDDPNPDNIE